MSIKLEDFFKKINTELSEMAKPHSMHTSIDYYHGSSLTDQEIKDVLKNGFDIKKTDIKYKDNMNAPQKPVEGHVYLTTKRSMALVYACKGDFSTGTGTKWNFDYEKHSKNFKKDTKAVVFEIDGKELSDIYPDEDEVGHALYNALRKKEAELQNYEKELIKAAKQVLTAKQIKAVQEYNDYSDLIKAGKKILYTLSDETMYYIMLNGTNLSNKGKLVPKKAYVLSYEDFDKVKTITDFFRIAKVL